jgi:hypothetical protein
MVLALMFGGAVFGQGDGRPPFQAIPILGVTTTDEMVKTGDLANHAFRVNVVAGSGGGVSGTIGTLQGPTVAPAGAVDPSGFTASLSVSNTGALNVTCDNCSSSASTFAAPFPVFGGAIGFKDGGGMLASATVDNAGNQFVIASQSSSAWTVIATGTVTAHQGDTWTVQQGGSWTVNCSNCGGSSTTSYGATFPSAGVAIGVKDGSGVFASMVVDNASNLFVIASQSSSPWTVNATGTITAHQGDTWTVQSVQSGVWLVNATGTITAHQGDTWSVNCTNCSGASTTNFGSVFPSSGSAIGFRDGAGNFASATVDQSSNLFVIASQGQANANQPWFATGTISAHQADTWTVQAVQSGTWTVNATGTITAHQGDTWTVNCSNCSGTSTTNYAAAFPSAGLAIGFKDGAGRFASATVDNAGILLVTASQGTANQASPWYVRSGAAIGAAYPTSTVFPIGFKDGQGFLASATVDNTGTLTVIASQGAANSAQPWFATGTMNVHQQDTWTVQQGNAPWSINISQYGGTTVVNGGTSGLVGVGGPTASGSQASANPLRSGAVGRPTNKPTVTDGQVADLIVTGSSELWVRPDTSAATGTIAPGRVNMNGGMGRGGIATAVTVCDQFATVSLGWQAGNTQVITGIGSGQIHICSINLIVASATALSIFEGSGTLCNTNRTPIFGSTATFNGINLATNGGFTQGTGFGDIAVGQYTNSNICIGNSTSAGVTGGIKWTSY